MKITIELDIPKDTYVKIVKWLKSYGAEDKLDAVLKRELELTIQKWKWQANQHAKSGLNAFERFKAQITGRVNNEQ